MCVAIVVGTAALDNGYQLSYRARQKQAGVPVEHLRFALAALSRDLGDTWKYPFWQRS